MSRDPRERRPQGEGEELERLLDLADTTSRPPRDVSARVLEGLRARDERTLDALLELARDTEAPPVGLEARVAHAMDGARADRARRGFRLLPGGRAAQVAVGVAAAALLALGTWRVVGGASEPPTQDEGTSTTVATGAPDEVAGAPEAELPEAELLSLLPVLERWELVTGADDSSLDPTDLDTLAQLDEEDELMLLLLSEENG